MPKVNDLILGVNATDVDPELIPPRTLTPSAIEKFCFCPGAYEYSYVLLIYANVYRAALTMGTAGHDAVEVLKLTGDLSAALVKGEQAFEAELSKLGEHVDGEALAAAQTAMRMDRAKFRAFTTVYAEVFHTGGTPDRDFVFEQTERVLGPMLMINPATGAWSQSFAIAGKSDGAGVMREPLIRRAGTFELKTSGEAYSDLMAALRYGVQIPTYQWMTAQVDRERPAFAIADIINKPRIRRLGATKKRLTPESPDDFEQRAIEKYREDPDTFFHREEFMFDEENVHRALSVFWDVGQKILLSDRHGYLRPRGRHCRTSFGWCEYQELCWYSDTSGYRRGDIAHEELGIAS